MVVIRDVGGKCALPRYRVVNLYYYYYYLFEWFIYKVYTTSALFYICRDAGYDNNTIIYIYIEPSSIIGIFIYHPILQNIASSLYYYYTIDPHVFEIVQNINGLRYSWHLTLIVCD